MISAEKTREVVLEPCPFPRCGSGNVLVLCAEFDEHIAILSGSDRAYKIQCQGCGAQGTKGFDLKKVIEHWNHREG
jgi:hypothetical protein